MSDQPTTSEGQQEQQPQEQPQQQQALTEAEMLAQVEADHQDKQDELDREEKKKDDDEPVSDEEGVTERHTISSVLFDNLKNMGFSENAIKKSIASGCINEDTCTQWITMHAGHPDLDTDLEPHVRVYVKKKRILTAEEQVAKVAELKQKIKDNKAAEAVAMRESDRAAEKARIAMGKNAAEVKEAIEDRKRKAAQEERRKEKAADAAAREKVQLDLLIDKLLRQGKARGPDEARRMAIEEIDEKKKKIEEERKAHAEQQLKDHQQELEERAKINANTNSSSGGGGWNLGAVLGDDQVRAGEQYAGNAQAASQPSAAAASNPTAAAAIETGVDEFGAVLVTLPTRETFRQLKLNMQTHELSTNDADGMARYLTAVTTLTKILSGVQSAPMDSRKRSLRLGNTMIQSRILTVPHAAQYLRQAGFERADAASGKLEDAHLTMSSVILRHIGYAVEVLQEE